MVNDLYKASACYVQALILRPNYPSVYANIAYVLFQWEEYHKAAEQFLNALILNSNILHLWDDIKASLERAGRPDLVEMTYAKNAELFRDYLCLIEKNDLPVKHFEGMETPEELLK